MRLNLQSLNQIPAHIATPRYDPHTLGVGIVHLGIGAFHRAHQAVYTEAAITAAGGDWGICGVSMKSPTVREQLMPQEGLYALREVSANADRWQIIGSVREVLFIGDELQKVIARIARAETHIVTMTVTEKGYCANIATRELLWSHPDVVNDLSNPHSPVSAIGVLVAGLYERFRKRGAPIAVICCDNLQENGRVLESLVHQFVEKTHPQIFPWLRDNVTFPCSMVDRIVPATQPADIAESAVAMGVNDHGVVRAEPFSQWVIEDKFATPRPAWDRVGVQFVNDVRPFETMKLRLLNGTHSLLAYLGMFSGIDTIAETMARIEFRNAGAALMTENIVTLDAAPEIDLAQYQRDLLTRFTNPAIGHRTSQVAMDGSQKLPQRLVAPVRVRASRGLASPMSALTAAAWIHYLTGRNFVGVTHVVTDPRSAHYATLWAQSENDVTRFAASVLDDETVFADVGKKASFRSAVMDWASRLQRDGAMKIAAAVSGKP
jgi:fructuronate reductase